MCFYENSIKIKRLYFSNSSQNFGQLFLQFDPQCGGKDVCLL
jgi:hypothetical protein